MKVLTVKQVADLLQAKQSTVYAWAEQGMIPSMKLNGLLRFSEEEILSWIQTCRTPRKKYTLLSDRGPRKEARG